MEWTQYTSEPHVSLACRTTFFRSSVRLNSYHESLQPIVSTLWMAISYQHDQDPDIWCFCVLTMKHGSQRKISELSHSLSVFPTEFDNCFVKVCHVTLQSVLSVFSSLCSWPAASPLTDWSSFQVSFLFLY